jgi:uncharacterized membrane protein YsdA (DUF1294 family)
MSLIKGKNRSYVIVIPFFIAITLSVLLASIPIVVLAFYLTVSLVTYLAYAVDKSAAKRGRWRTPENRLHFLSLACGWPGALIAQQTFRHKSQKQPFRSIFWITVIANCGGFIWLLTPTGKLFINNLVGQLI